MPERDALREATENLLDGTVAWPLGTMLPVKRLTEEEGGTVIETGLIRRAAGETAEAVVYMEDGGPVTRRQYADVGQLLDAGWRAD